MHVHLRDIAPASKGEDKRPQVFWHQSVLDLSASSGNGCLGCATAGVIVSIGYVLQRERERNTIAMFVNEIQYAEILRIAVDKQTSKN